MPDSDEIRDRAIEVLARHMFESDGPDEQYEGFWEGRYRRYAGPYVDALAAAGLLPTGEEWGTRPNDGLYAGTVMVKGPEEKGVREYASALPAHEITIVHRYTHDWQEEGAA